MSDPKYKHIGEPSIKLIEECSGVIKEACKGKRFGWANFHPEDPHKRTNVARVLMEIVDLEEAISEFKKYAENMDENGCQRPLQNFPPPNIIMQKEPKP